MRDLSALLHPRSVAIVGASTNLKSPPGKPARFIRDSGVDIAVYPVNPSHEEIAGYRAYPVPASLPEAPDVAIVVVPATAVLPAVEALGKRGTKSAIVMTSGFGEGERTEGAAAQRRLREIAREYDMALLGPNTLGVHDYVRGLPLSFVWYGKRPESLDGSVAVVAQSGSGMTAICDRLIGNALPVGFGIATGNEADLTIVDVIEQLAEDPSVKVIVMLFEEIRDGAGFLRVARRLRDLGKPLVALKVGRTASGSEMVKSHTGALAGSYPVLRALLKQYGVLEVTDLDQISATAAAALLGHFPPTDGIAVVTNSGGAAAIAADRADELGVPLPPLGSHVQARVAENLPDFAQGQPVHNPIDVTAQNVRRPNAIVDITAALLDDESVGGVVVALASGASPDGLPWTDKLIELVRGSAKPVVVVVLSEWESAKLQTRLRAGGVPVVLSPAAAVEVLERLRRFSRAVVGDAVSSEISGETSPSSPLPTRTHPLFLADKPTSEYDTLRWLAGYGVPVAQQHLARTPEEAAQAAAQIGFPVAVKVSSPDIAHKTEIGGVALGLSDAEAVSEATRRILAAARAALPDARLDGVTVAAMISAELELISGIHRDPTFGPVILLGLGGIWAEVLGDVALRGLPLVAGADRAGSEITRMIDELQGAALLRGARGRTAVNLDDLNALLAALARIASEYGDRLRGLDLNPVAVREDGHLVVLDASLFLNEN